MDLDSDDTPVAPITMKKSLRKQLCQIDNDHCIIVEFPNEDGDLQTAFMAWLKKSDANEIDEIIIEGREIEIYWPLDCTIQPAQKMIKNLTTANFYKVVAIIKAQGGKKSVLF